MKRIFTVALVLLASVTMAIGQSRPALRVDANFVGSNQSMKRDGYVWGTKMNVGLRVGAAAEFMIGSRGFYLAPGLNYTMKGSKIDRLAAAAFSLAKSELYDEGLQNRMGYTRNGSWYLYYDGFHSLALSATADQCRHTVRPDE
ncbi:hypothetical protein [Porphyromonas gingivalis]|uniref:hypothetical protein n=1 Tax=Porphyromonas gingivalis TaxID=837 RepID=UPI001E434DD8|nr:hypothetical protein [Porphyromonas gingivalis]